VNGTQQPLGKENEVEHSAASADQERARQEFAELSNANSKIHRPSTYQDDGPDQNRYWPYRE
jgi:hypothetical protein